MPLTIIGKTIDVIGALFGYILIFAKYIIFNIEYNKIIYILYYFIIYI